MVFFHGTSKTSISDKDWPSTRDKELKLLVYKSFIAEKYIVEEIICIREESYFWTLGLCFNALSSADFEVDQDDVVAPVVCPSVVNQKSCPLEPESEVSVMVLRSCSRAGSYTSKPVVHVSTVFVTPSERISAISPESWWVDQKGSVQVAGWDRWNIVQSLLLRKVIYPRTLRCIFANPTNKIKIIIENTYHNIYLRILPKKRMRQIIWYKNT